MLQSLDMAVTCKIVFGLYLSALLYRSHAFVLLTANVEDLKRIAQKFVSDSVADKIAKVILEAADSTADHADNSTNTGNISDYNDEFDVEKKETKTYDGEEFRHKVTSKVEDYKPIKPKKYLNKTDTYKQNVQATNKNAIKKKKHTKSKTKATKTVEVKPDQSSLEYYRSNKQLNKIDPKSFIELEKIHESDESSTTTVKISRKDFKAVNLDDETEEVLDENDRDTIQKYVEGDVSTAIKDKEDKSEKDSEDFNYSNRLDTKSEELSTPKANLTTEIERNEFDQYFNTNYPKADVVATSGLVELTKSTKRDSSETDYD